MSVYRHLTLAEREYIMVQRARVCLQFTQSGNQTMMQPKRTMLR